MSLSSDLDEAKTLRGAMPPGARRALFAAIAMVLLGALYLIAVRGEALLLDLATFSQRIFCF